MTIGGAIAELQNLINADDVPFYYKGGIEKVIETISMELPTIEVSEDCISRQAAIDALAKFVPYAICDESTESYTNGLTDAYNLICQLPSAQPEQRWIPFKTRPLTEEEEEEHPEWDGIFDCKLPDDGQRILVSVSVRGHERVQYDEFYTDDGCYLDSGYEIGTEAVAWMPLPEPYRESEE